LPDPAKSHYIPETAAGQGMEPTDRVDLAQAPGFVLGRLAVRPAVRQLVRDDGLEEVLQHRVMQVLIALARADGGIVTRDQLTMSCWDGRVVGEDAINRILSRLRAVAAGIGAGSFRIETITRIGYRLLREGQEAPDAVAPSVPALESPGPSRRKWLVGAGAAGVATLAGGWWWWRGRAGPPSPSPEVEALMRQALQQLAQNTREGQNQAIGLYRRVVALAPDYADGWGSLGCAYAATAFFRPVAESDALRARAMAAGRRALGLDPGNGYGQVAVATAVPGRGSWLGMDRALRHALTQHAENQQLLFATATLYASVGRNLEGLALVERLARLAPPPPDVHYLHVHLLWAANRLDEADRLIEEAASVYPTQYAIWFIRFYLLLYSGRASAAVAMIEDRDRLPTNIPLTQFDDLLRDARAIQSRAPADLDRAVAAQLARAHQGAGFAEGAMQYAAAAGRLDDAFAILVAYYFGRGFVVPDVRFTVEGGTYSPQRDRITAFLFLPHMRAVRADPRFAAAMAELGMARYWAGNGTLPDYQRG
jgi:DNA-binding winged helix-turn-helix (wHTH) protein/tetratricopeptide (TPR) repeat protein